MLEHSCRELHDECWRIVPTTNDIFSPSRYAGPPMTSVFKQHLTFRNIAMGIAGTTACFTYSFWKERHDNEAARVARGEPAVLPQGVLKILPSGAWLMSEPRILTPRPAFCH